MEYNKKIDSYNITEVPLEETEAVEQRLKNVVITYFSDEEFFASSPTYRVPEEKIHKIKELLFDHTVYNLNVDSVARAIPFLTIVNEIERIVYDE